MSSKYNFTYELTKPSNNDWGLFPTSGPFNLSGTWDGVMGNVVNGDSHVSFNAWIWNSKRRDILDFVPLFSERCVVAYTPKPPVVDLWSLMRCFRCEAWYGVILTFCLAVGVILITFTFFDKSLASTSAKISLTSGWLCYVLISAYYGGALTMFFASEPELPFDTIQGAIRSYPGGEMSYSILIAYSKQ